jgi:hypothetical protein
VSLPLRCMPLVIEFHCSAAYMWDRSATSMDSIDCTDSSRAALAAAVVAGAWPMSGRPMESVMHFGCSWSFLRACGFQVNRI